MEEETSDMTWEFNAPRAFDFTKQDDDDMENPEDYFNFDHENNVPISLMETTGETETATASDLNQKYDCENVNDDQNNNITQDTKDFVQIEDNSSHVPAEEQDNVCEDHMKPVDDSPTPPVPSGSTEHIASAAVDAARLIKSKIIEALADSRDKMTDKNDVTAEGSSDRAVSATEDTVCHIKSVVCDIPTNERNGKRDTTVVGADENTDVGTERKESCGANSTLARAPKEDTTCAATKGTEDSGSVILPNIVTASELADWNRAKKVTTNSGQMKSKVQKKQQERRSKRLSLIRSQRRSTRLAPSSAPCTSADGPPTKRPRKSMKKTPGKVAAVTPDVLRRSTQKITHKHVKSTEDLEIERIEEMRHHTKQLSEESSKSLKRALSGAGLKKPKPLMKRTKPLEFKFHTDERIKSSGRPSVSNTPQIVDFSKELRKHPPSPKKLVPTKPQPFNLSTTRKRKMENSEYVPMARALLDFQTKPRMRTKTASRPGIGPMKAVHKLTVAKSPQLESKTRARSQAVISAKQAEELEVQEMKNYQFKAKPVNRDILEHASALPEVERKEPTKVIGFNLEIGKRFEGRQKEDKPTSPTKEFKARPIPKEIFNKVTGMKEAAAASVTTPSSPAFALKHRMPVAQKNKENFEAQRALKLAEKRAEKPHAHLPMNVAFVARKKKCETKPFSFDAKDKERFAKKEEKIQGIIQREKEAASSFKATPILIDPCPEASLPSKQVRPRTEAKPFKFASNEIGAQKAAKWREGVEEEMKVLKEKAEFKANTNYVKVLYGKGFQPVKEGKHTEVTNDFRLHTEKRASQRHEFDERMRTKEEELQMNRLRQQELDEEKDKEEIAKMRREAEHSAAPIRNYKPVVIAPSTKPLTEAMSPSFSQRFSK